jgi:hypothetical protein
VARAARVGVARTSTMSLLLALGPHAERFVRSCLLPDSASPERNEHNRRWTLDRLDRASWNFVEYAT